jgi:hypothetical protein
MKNLAVFVALFTVMMLASPVAQHAGHHPPSASTPYSALEQRAIKALSQSQIEDLNAGRGMGLALAAELNGYPGPMHVLEHAEKLHLTPDQTVRMQSQVSAMREEAIRIGKEIIAAETALDALFASGNVAPDTLAVLVGRIAEAQGRLRETHLRYHLDTRAALSKAQIEHYARLRGYAR